MTKKNWLTIHLYLALGAGFLFALIGLTGSLCVYQAELDGLFNPELRLEQHSGQYLSLDKIMAAVLEAHPQRSGSWTLELPSDEQGVITAWYEKPRETFFEAYAPLMVSINPYTAEIIKSRFWGETLSTWLLNLHSQLLMAGNGSILVGILGILLSVSAATGLYLGWPGVVGFRKAFAFRPHQGIKQLLFDVHRWLGFLSALGILLLALTGTLLSFPSILENLFGASGMEHGQTGRSISSTADPHDHPTSLAGAVFIARAPFPKAQLRRVTTPLGSSGVYRINLRQGMEINHRHPYTTVWIDRWSGQIKEVRDPGKFSVGETLTTWVWPLHTGEVLGNSGRFFWFMTGQAIFWLYISGVSLWLYRRGTFKDRRIDYSGIRRNFVALQHKAAALTAIFIANCLRFVGQAKKDYLPVALSYFTKCKQYLDKFMTSLDK